MLALNWILEILLISQGEFTFSFKDFSRNDPSLKLLQLDGIEVLILCTIAETHPISSG